MPRHKVVSYGVLIENEHRQLLVAHATDAWHWDIPKGGADGDETPLEAAVRETLEETGIALQPDRVQDIGVFAYRPDKDLHLFRTVLHTTEFDIANCCCTSFFPHARTGAPTPEADEFRWIDRGEIPKYCAKNLVKLLSTILTDVYTRDLDSL